jgi:hypothetical protein
MELNKPPARWKEPQIRSIIQRWLWGQFLEELIRYQIESRDGPWRLPFEFDTAAWQRLIDHRLGAACCLPIAWTGAPSKWLGAIPASKQSRESSAVSGGLPEGDWLGWGPMYPWTDRKIRIHAFYCMLAILLLQHLHKQAQSAWNGISTEQLLEELRQIQAVRSVVPTARRERPQPHRHRAV